MCHSISMKIIKNEKMINHYIEISKIYDWLPFALRNQVKLYRYQKGEFICKENRSIDTLFMQVHGKSKVTRSMNNGKETLTCFNEKLTMLGGLELFAEMVAFNNVEVIEDTFCLAIPLNETNKKILLEDACFLRYMAKDLAKMLIKENQNSAINLAYPVRQRVASYILCTQHNHIFKDNYTHLAEYLGCSHRQLLRVLNGFVSEGMLENREDGYHILKKRQLETIAAELYSK